MNKAERRTERRQRMIDRGRRSFAIRYGVMGFGISAALLFALYQGYSEGWESFPRWLAISLLVFPIGGWFWGVIMWRFVIRGNEGATK